MNAKHQNDDVEFTPDAEGSAPERMADLAKIREKLARAEAEKQEYLDGWQRAKADLANYKKDEGKRFEAMSQFAAESIIADIIPVLDSFDLALGHGVAAEVERGIQLIRAQLEDVLRRRGVTAIQAKGAKFDPALHEAIGEVVSDGEEGMVAEEVQRGYRLYDKVIRPARVKISKSPKSHN